MACDGQCKKCAKAQLTEGEKEIAAEMKAAAERIRQHMTWPVKVVSVVFLPGWILLALTDYFLLNHSFHDWLVRLGFGITMVGLLASLSLAMIILWLLWARPRVKKLGRQWTEKFWQDAHYVPVFVKLAVTDHEQIHPLCKFFPHELWPKKEVQDESKSI